MNTRLVEVIEKAISEDKHISFDYKGGNRIVEPKELDFKKLYGNFIGGYSSSGDKGSRTYFLSEISNLKILEHKYITKDDEFSSGRANLINNLFKKINLNYSARVGKFFRASQYGIGEYIIEIVSGDKVEYTLCPGCYGNCFVLLIGEIKVKENNIPHFEGDIENLEEEIDNGHYSDIYLFHNMKNVVLSIVYHKTLKLLNKKG